MAYKNSHDYNKFVGNWIAGNEFNGTLMYKNGDLFVGSFRDGRIYDGTLTFANFGEILESKETRR
jgi:hypothetical protein